MKGLQVRLAHVAGKRPLSRTDHWSFLFGQIAIYSLVVLVLTGAFLTFFYDPDTSQVIYQGACTPLRGVPISRAFASTLEVSLEVRGGLTGRRTARPSSRVRADIEDVFEFGLGSGYA